MAEDFTFDDAVKQVLAKGAAPETGAVIPLVDAPASSSEAFTFDDAVKEVVGADYVPQATKVAPQAQERIKTDEETGPIDALLGGVGLGVSNLKTTADQLSAVGSQVAGDTEAVGIKIEGLGQRAADYALRRESFTQFDEAFDSPGNFVEWAAFTLGEQVPNMAAIIAGGGLAAVAAKAVAAGTISASTASMMGAYVSATAIETGATAGEQALEVGEISPKVAVISGMAKGALESLTPLALGKMTGVLGGTGDDVLGLLGRAMSSEGGRLARAGKGFVKGGLTEAATELMQEYLDIAARIYVDETYADKTEEQKARLLEATVSALVAGGAMTSIASSIPGTPSQEYADTAPVDTTVLEEAVPVIDPVIVTPSTPETPEEGGEVIVGPAQASLIENVEQLNVPLGQAEIAARDDLDDLVYVGPKAGIEGTAEYMEFLPQDESFAQAAIQPEGGDARNQIFLQATKGAFTASSLTSNLAGVPAVLTRGDPDVQFVGEVNQAQEVKLIKQVNKARALLATQTLNAKELYVTAVKAGFRYTPQEGAGVLAITPPAANSTVLRDQMFASGLSSASKGRTVQFAQSAMQNGFVPLTETGKQEFNRRFGLGVTGERSIKTGLYRQQKVENFTMMNPWDALGLGYKGTNGYSVEDYKAAVEAGTIRVKLIPGVTVEDMLQFQPKQFMDAVQKGLRVMSANANHDLVMAVKHPARTDMITEDLIPGDAKEPQGTLENSTTAEWLGRTFESNLQHTPEDFTGDIVPVGLDNVMMLKSLTDREKRRGRVLVRMGETLRKTFLPKDTLTIILTDGLNAGATLGWHMGSSVDNSHVITMDVTRTSMAQAVTTFAHEFGHAISSSYMHGAITRGDVLASEVMSAYERWVLRVHQLNLAEQSSIEGFASRRRHQIVQGHVMDSLTAMRRRPLIGRILEASADSSSGPYYLASFEEWIAEQMAQSIEHTSVQGLGKLERLFVAVRRKVMRMYQQVVSTHGKDVDTLGEPNSAFTSLLDYLRENGVTDKTAVDHIRARQTSDTVWAKSISSVVPKSDMAVSLSKVAKHPRMKSVMAKKLPDGRSLAEATEQVEFEAGHFNSMVKWGWNVLQMAQKNVKIRALQVYVDLAELWQNEKNKWQSRANETLRDWGQLGKDRSENFAAFLFALDGMEYLAAKEKPRHPTKPEMAALIKKYNMDKGMWKLYLRVKGDFAAMLDRMEQVLIEQVREADPSVVGDINVQSIKRDFAQYRLRPYFPHSRFGNWSVVVTNNQGKTVHIEFVEAGVSGTVRGAVGGTPKKVLAMQAELQNSFPDHKIGVGRVPESMESFTGMPSSVLRLIKDKLGDSLDPAELDWLNQIAVEFVPAQSFRKKFKRRQDKAGFSQDAMRTYADYFWHGSNHLARITYGSKMATVIKDFVKENSMHRRNGENVSKRDQMAEFLDDHLKNILNPKPDWAQMRSFAFTWWLGFSPASAVLNFTQLPMVTLPYLSSRFGDLKAANAMRKAMVDLRKMYTDPDTMAKKWNPADAKLLEIALQQSILEQSMAADLVGVAEGGGLVRARHGSKMQRALSTFAEASGWMFQASEKINRRVTFNAAVRMARENPETPYLKELQTTHQRELTSLIEEHGIDIAEATAFLAGKDAVQRTQFEYGAWAKPRFMRGRKGVLFTFFMFLQNMLWAVGNSPGNKRILLTMLAMGGLMGLPGAEDLAAIADALGKKIYGKHFKIEEEIGELLTELFGSSRAADNILHGTAREGFGLNALGDLAGVPIPQFDMSGNVGMGNVVPGLQEAMKLGSGATFEETLGRAGTDIAGASFGIGINLMKFLGDRELPFSDMKRWERAMPRAMKNVTRSLRYLPEDTNVAKITGAFVQPEGRERNRKGGTIVEFNGSDPEHMMEIALQGMGFGITRLNREWNEIIAKVEVEKYWSGRRSGLMTQYWHTLYTNDKEARRDVIDAILRFNKSVPFGEMGIRSPDLKTSVKIRTKSMLLQQNKIGGTKRYRRLNDATGDKYYTDDDVVGVEVVK